MTGLRNSGALVSVLILTSASLGAEPVRVSVFGLFHPRTVTVEASKPMTAKIARREIVIEPGRQVAMSAAGGKVILRSGDTRLLGKKAELVSRDGGELEFTLAVPGKIRRRYRGRLVVVTDGRELVPVVSMELETAVASITAAEAAPGTPMEGLKAEAVAIRSYLVAGGPRHPYSDFCDTTHCQFLKSPPAANSLAAQAVLTTRGLVLAWQGKAFAAMYSASCAGRTHSLAEIGYAQRDYPYFGVECEYCRRHPERWSATISEEDAAVLAKKSEAERLRLARKLGWNTVPSNDYSAKVRGGVVDLSGVGRGHGLGLCERGGAAMAREGKSFREILEHYYPNTTLVSIEPSGDRAIVPAKSRQFDSFRFSTMAR